MDEEVRNLATRIGVSETNLSENQVRALETVARTLRRSESRSFVCSVCGKRYRIPGAKEGGSYKCISCQGLLKHGNSTGEAETILDEALPKDAAEAIKDAANVLGKFVLVKKLGAGGMGSVFKAYDVELARYVAIKFINSALFDELISEARALASIDHKNIAKVYEINNSFGTPFIAMQFVDGKTIPHSALHLPHFIAVCEAVDYAHKFGLMHRDIKPDNIMVDSKGNIFLIDFGLATRKSADGELAGTPGYIAPETAEGKAYTVAADVYSLAATFYHLLAGAPPMKFDSGSDIQQIVIRTREGVFAPLGPQVPAELRAIVEKGLAKSPADRYQSAGELSEDIRNYLNGFPVRAFRGGFGYIFKKFVLRNRFVTAAAVILAAGIAAAGIYSGFQKKETETISKKKTELVSAIIDDLSKKHEYALKLRRAGETFEGLAAIPNEVLQSKLYREVADEAEKDAGFLHSMGNLYKIVQNYEKALEYQRRVLEMDANFKPALFQIGLLLAYRFETDVNYDDKGNAQAALSSCTPKAGTLAEYCKRVKTDSLEGALELLYRTISVMKLFPENQLAAGIVNLYNGKSKEATQIINAVLEKDKSNEDAIYFLDAACCGVNKFDMVPVLNEAISLDKGNMNLYMLRSDCHYILSVNKYHGKNDGDEELHLGAADVQTILSLKSSDPNLLVWAAVFWGGAANTKLSAGYDAASEIGKTFNYFDEALKKQPNNYKILVERESFRSTMAEIRIREGQAAPEVMREMEKDNETISKILPNASWVPRLLAHEYERCASAAGEAKLDQIPYLEKALAACDRCLKLSPADVIAARMKYRMMRNLIRCMHDERKEAAAWLEKWGAFLPAFVAAEDREDFKKAAYFEVANYWHIEGDKGNDKVRELAAYRNAVKFCGEYLKLSPDDNADDAFTQTPVSVIVYQLCRGDFPAYRSSQSLGGTGTILRIVGKRRLLVERALALAKIAQRVEPDEAGSVNEQALADVSEALKCDDRFGDVHRYAALTQMMIAGVKEDRKEKYVQLYQDAIENLKFVLQKDRDYADMWKKMGKCYLEIASHKDQNWVDPVEDYEEAAKCYTNAIALEPKEPFHHSDRGLVYRRLGSYTESVKGDPLPMYEKSIEDYTAAVSIRGDIAKFGRGKAHAWMVKYQLKNGIDASAGLEKMSKDFTAYMGLSNASVDDLEQLDIVCSDLAKTMASKGMNKPGSELLLVAADGLDAAAKLAPTRADELTAKADSLRQQAKELLGDY